MAQGFPIGLTHRASPQTCYVGRAECVSDGPDAGRPPLCQNQIASTAPKITCRTTADRLVARGITYAPDFLVNAANRLETDFGDAAQAGAQKRGGFRDYVVVAIAALMGAAAFVAVRGFGLFQLW